MPRTPNTTCEWCRHPFYARPNHLARGCGRYCSRHCQTKSGWAEEQRQRMSDRHGEKNPNFKHGRRVGARRWNLKRKGEFVCRSCLGRADHLHHAIPKTKCGELKANLLNGLPLCAGCHTRWHKGHPIRKEVFTEEEWECLSSATIPGWETEAWLSKHYPSAASIAERALVVA